MSMTRDQMLRYIDDPSVLNERTLGELHEILDEFPYFQSAHLLYVRNMQNESNFRFAGQLKTCALYATDRTILYHLLNPGPAEKRISDSPLEMNVVSVPENRATIELSEDLPEPGKESGESFIKMVNPSGRQHLDLLNFELPETAYALDEPENEMEKPLSELASEISDRSSKRGKGIGTEQNTNLIDRFIKDNPAFTVKQPVNSDISEKMDNQQDNIGESDEFITETLARIYMKQGLYQKAIKAFEKLSLKYPEKSAYFARQIEEVTNLLNK